MAPTDIQSWLKEQMVSADAYDADLLVERFLSEMQNGLNGEASSLAMIPAYVSSEGDVPVDRPVAVIDAGGTNLRIGIARFDADRKIALTHFSKQAIPGRDVEASAAEFYAVMVDALAPVRDAFDDIGFCFSYPAGITPDYDGKLLHWTKEIKVPELVGTHVGAGLLGALEARGIAGKKVVVLNDTVAALLAGVAAGQAFDASSYAGFILGTGTNTAYVEQNRNIGKLEGVHDSGSQVINVESGGFAGFERGPIDLAMDAESENPGKHVFEKTISGVYMGPLALRLMKGLVAQGAFSGNGGKTLADMTELSTIGIDNLCADNGRDVGILGTDCFTDADREVMKEVFSAVVDRAALLTAVNLTAAIVKSGAGQDPARPVCINIDGSTYYKTFRMPEKVQAQLQRLLTARSLHVRCIQVDDAPVVGAAIAGLTTIE